MKVKEMIELVDGMNQLLELIKRREIDRPFFEWSLSSMIHTVDKYIPKKAYEKHDKGLLF